MRSCFGLLEQLEVAQQFGLFDQLQLAHQRGILGGKWHGARGAGLGLRGWLRRTRTWGRCSIGSRGLRAEQKCRDERTPRDARGPTDDSVGGGAM